MFKSFKDFYNKHDFNYSAGIVDPFKFHTTFYKVLVLFKVAETEDKQKVTWFNQNTLIFATGLLATIQIFISLCHGLQIFEILDITEAGTYFIILFYELLIQTSIKKNLTEYYNLQRAMKADFYYICTEGQKYRQKYFKNQLLTWKICIYTCVFTASIGLGIVCFTSFLLITYLSTYKPGDEGSRPLLFPFWLPNVDFGKTPYYEIAFVFSNLCATLYAYNYIFMIQTQIVWIRHIADKVDIVIWSIQDLMEGIRPSTNKTKREYYSKLLESRLRKIVIHHQAMIRIMEDHATVYRKMLMFEQKCCGPVICLTAYCTVTKLEQDQTFQPVLPLLCFGTIVLHFIPSYLCTFLAEKVRSVCDACWDTPFWVASPMIRPYMVLIMQRALRPLPVCIVGFDSFSIETFSKKMTSAYSTFNMLRQIDL